MNVTRPALGILLASLLAACSAIRPPVAATPAPAAAPKPSTEDSDESRLPRLELDERILFSVVAGEIAGQRGHTGAAAGTFLELAEETRDPRLARRAAEMALISGNLNQAISSLSLWSALDPESQLARQQLALHALPGQCHQHGPQQLPGPLLQRQHHRLLHPVEGAQSAFDLIQRDPLLGQLDDAILTPQQGETLGVQSNLVRGQPGLRIGQEW